MRHKRLVLISKILKDCLEISRNKFEIEFFYDNFKKYRVYIHICIMYIYVRTHTLFLFEAFFEVNSLKNKA